MMWIYEVTSHNKYNRDSVKYLQVYNEFWYIAQFIKRTR